jgi:hypothetical protein
MAGLQPGPYNPSIGTTTVTAAPVLSGTAFVGQAKIATTGTAVQLAANTLVNGVIISTKSTNAASITVGGSGVTNTVDGTGNGYILAAGASVSFAVTNTNVLWVNGTLGDVISIAGS